MPKGLFFTFDGLDGTGKSTQAQLTGDWLRGLGRQVVLCRDPGTTRLGESLRSLLLESRASADADGLPIHPRSETLMYMAARAQLVSEVIVPALDQGQTVISDRFVLANVVYQAYGLGIAPEEVWNLNKFPTQGIRPTATVVLDLDVPSAVSRREGGADRMEQRALEYHQRVREGFLAEAARNPEAIFVVDAAAPVEVVHQRVRSTLARWVA